MNITRLLIWLAVSLPAMLITASYRDEHGPIPFVLVALLSIAFAWVLRPAVAELPAPAEEDKTLGERPEHMRTWDV